MNIRFLLLALTVIAGIAARSPVLAMDNPEESAYEELQWHISNIQKCKQILLRKQFDQADQDESTKIVKQHLLNVKNQIREEGRQTNAGKAPLKEDEIESEAIQRLLEKWSNAETQLSTACQLMKEYNEELTQVLQRYAEVEANLQHTRQQIELHQARLNQLVQQKTYHRAP